MLNVAHVHRGRVGQRNLGLVQTNHFDECIQIQWKPVWWPQVMEKMCLSSFVIAFNVLSIAVYAFELACCIVSSCTFLCNYLSCVLVMVVWMYGFYFFVQLYMLTSWPARSILIKSFFFQVFFFFTWGNKGDDGDDEDDDNILKLNKNWFFAWLEENLQSGAGLMAKKIEYFSQFHSAR